MSASRPILLAFDLDGVLYSSEPFLGEAYREAIVAVNRQRPGSFDRIPKTDDILPFIGWPIPTIFANLFPDADESALSLLHDATLQEICDRVRARRGTLYEGVAETLRSLADGGFPLVVASNGRRLYIETVLATYQLSALFEPLITADEVEDKVGVLRHHIDHLTPELTIMIGDRTSDVEAAAAIKCPFIGCDYGHGHRDEIEQAGPVVDHFRQLATEIAHIVAEAR